MKIICDNCRTKYSIADEKVRGKVFKIRCKKCQNIIVVRGNQPQEEAQPAADSGDDYAGAGVGGDGETPSWHLVVNREQVGPMTASEVQDQYAKGEVNEDTYIWKEGFANWQRLGDTEEFAEMAQATKVAAPAMLAGAGAPEAEAADPGGYGAEPDQQWGQAAEAAPAPAQDQGWDQQPADDGVSWGQEPEVPQQAAPAPAPEPSPDPGFGAAAEPMADPAKLDQHSLAEDQQRDLFATYHGDDGLAPVDVGAMQGAGGADFGAASPDMFGQPQEQPAGEVVIRSTGGDDGAGLTGARNENSVLFSLSNLQDLAMGQKAEPVAAASPASAPSEAGDGSGLIDIRAMASSLTISSPAASDGSSALDDVPVLGGFSSPVAAAPVLMPTVEDEKPKWVLPLVLGMGVVLLGLVGLVVYLAVLRKPDPQAMLAANTAKATQPSSSDKTSNAPEKSDPADKTAGEAKDETKPAPAAEGSSAGGAEEKATTAADTKAEPAAKTEEAKGDKPRSKSKRRKGRRRRGRGGREPAAAPRASSSRGSGLPPARPSRARKRKRGGKDSLDDLIDGALAGGKKPKRRKPAAAAAPASNLPETLTKSEIQKGMRGTKAKVQGCFDRFKVPGLARVQITIGRRGRVTGAKVKGVFAGTPTGDCLSRAAKTARFPKFKGSPITITYPFILR